MSTSSQEWLEEIESLCENCRKVVVDDSWHRYNDREPISTEVFDGPDAESPTDYSLRDRFPRLPELEASSRHGCSFCGYLREMISSQRAKDFLARHYGISTTDSDTREIKITISFRWTKSLRLSLCLCAKIHFKHAKNDLILWSDVRTVSGYRDTAQWFQIPYTSDSSPTFEEIKELKSVITQCKHHAHQIPCLSYIPERLLDIREQVPRLVSRHEFLPEFESQSCKRRYAALSYCWGTSEEAKHQPKTTCLNITQREREIRYDELSPVLRDAVEIARILDIPFLWIDSLCILQDDISDWERQCPEMDNIYGHAEVTLVAASSNSCRESFLQPEVPRALLPVVSKWQPGLRALLQVEFSGCSDSSQHFSGMNDSRLATRGWAVQERVLSTRMVIFAGAQAHFVCPSYSSQTLYQPLGLSISTVREAETNELYAYWSKLLDEFKGITVDSFTQPTDLLPALSGLAAYFGGRLRDEYCAGHWSLDLHNSLMWLRSKPSRGQKALYVGRICSPSPYIVPSWSRLGKGETLTLFEPFHAHLHISPKTLGLDLAIGSPGQNPYGVITDAQLKIRSHTTSLQTAMATTQVTMIPFDARLYSHCWKVSFLIRDRSKSMSSRYIQRDERSFSCHVWVDYDLKTENVCEDAHGWKWVLLGTFYERPFGLLLHQAYRSKWCRVGIFDSREYEEHGEHQTMQLRDFIEMSDIETVIII